MWRFILAFVITALLTSTIWAAVAPRDGFLEDLGMIGLGFLGMVILGFEMFFRALTPDKEEVSAIENLFHRSPVWKKAFWTLGAVAGITGASLFFIVGKRSDSIWVAGIPIAAFFVCYMALQYIVPSIVSRGTAKN